jgi:L-lactate dehydrogenase complex protein LldG
MTSSRDVILESLRQGRPIGQDALPDLPPSPRESSDDWEAFAAAIAPLNGELVLCQDPEEFAARLREMLEALAVKSAVCWRHPLLEELDVSGLLRRYGVREPEPRPDALGEAPEAGQQRFCPQLAHVDLGITAADAVFVNAGTVVVMAGAGRPRSVSLAPPAHLAVVPQSALCQDLSSLPELLREELAGQGRLPSALHMITGASSTADIEQTLVRGVHGPGQVRVLGVGWK